MTNITMYTESTQVEINRIIKSVMENRIDDSWAGCIIFHDLIELPAPVVKQRICRTCGYWEFDTFKMR